MKRKRWAIFISGRGSNLRSLLQQYREEICLVVSSKKNAQGLQIAKRFGVKTLVLKKEIDWAELSQVLSVRRVDRVFLAGFMKIVPAEFIDLWQGKILNVHPSLLPAHPGLGAMKKSFECGDPMGVTVHEAVAEMDAGPVVLRKESVAKGEAREWSRAKQSTHIVEQNLVVRCFSSWRSHAAG